MAANIFSYLNFKILVSKIISHMGKDFSKVPLALIKILKIENYNTKILYTFELVISQNIG